MQEKRITNEEDGMGDDAREAMIVAATDGSEHSLGAARWAARWAAHRGRELVVLFVTDAGEARAATPLERAVDEDLVERSAAVATSLREQFPDLLVTPRVVEGHPVAALVDMSATAELVVLGTRPLGGVLGKMLGSVADSVVAKARGPIAVVPLGTADNEGPVLLGMDLVVPPLHAARVAFVAAETLGTSVIAALVDDPARPPGLNSPDADFSEFAPSMGRDVQVLRTLEPVAQDFSAITCTTRIEIGATADALLDCAEEAGLVVVGTRRRSRLMCMLFGSVSHTVVREAPCPAIIVPSEK